MKPVVFVGAIVLIATNIFGHSAAGTQLDKARQRAGDLRFSSYATSCQVEQLATDETVRMRAWESIRRMGITKL